MGITGCWFCYQCLFCKETKPLQLNKIQKIFFIITNVFLHTNNKTILENIVCNNDKIIVWEIQRPFIKQNFNKY